MFALPLTIETLFYADVISAFNDTSRYLNDIFNIDSPFFWYVVPIIYPKEPKLNKANTSNASAAVLDLDLSINNGVISSKHYDERDDFDFSIVNFPFLDGDVPPSPSYGINIFEQIRFSSAHLLDNLTHGILF